MFQSSCLFGQTADDCDSIIRNSYNGVKDLRLYPIWDNRSIGMTSIDTIDKMRLYLQYFK